MGSNSTLVAPVTIGDGAAYTAAGSVITRNAANRMRWRLGGLDRKRSRAGQRSDGRRLPLRSFTSPSCSSVLLNSSRKAASLTSNLTRAQSPNRRLQRRGPLTELRTEFHKAPACSLIDLSAPAETQSGMARAAFRFTKKVTREKFMRVGNSPCNQ